MKLNGDEPVACIERLPTRARAGMKLLSPGARNIFYFPRLHPAKQTKPGAFRPKPGAFCAKGTGFWMNSRENLSQHSRASGVSSFIPARGHGRARARNRKSAYATNSTSVAFYSPTTMLMISVRSLMFTSPSPSKSAASVSKLSGVRPRMCWQRMTMSSEPTTPSQLASPGTTAPG